MQSRMIDKQSDSVGKQSASTDDEIATKVEMYLEALQSAGYRRTTQRQKVCEFLAHTKIHPTPSQIFEGIKDVYPAISRATVYNTLNALESLGVITTIHYGDDHKHYETDLHPHINLICVQCHAVTDYHWQTDHQPHVTFPLFDALANIPEPALYLGAQIMADTGFQPILTKTEIHGLCGACRTA